MRLSNGERIAALRLARTADIGPITFRNLIDRYGSASAAIDALTDFATRTGGKKFRAVSVSQAEDELEHIDRIGAQLIVFGETDYPDLLRETEGSPPVLTVLGTLEPLSQSSIAIVGARNASLNGRKLAQTISSGLGLRAHIIVSGLARGIDAAAHRGALETGTIAVLAGGIDKIYPDEHTELAEDIVKTGALVSEMPFGHTARAADFPRRNRIIAGLARATLVIEAAERSGSLITARLAGDFGRDVFACPGSPLDPRCLGSNRLIKEGAMLTENADDVHENLSPRENPLRPQKIKRVVVNAPKKSRARPRDENLNQAGELSHQILELLGPSPVIIDELVRETGASASTLQAALLELELAGKIVRHPGHMVSRAENA